MRGKKIRAHILEDIKRYLRAHRTELEFQTGKEVLAVLRQNLTLPEDSCNLEYALGVAARSMVPPFCFKNSSVERKRERREYYEEAQASPPRPEETLFGMGASVDRWADLSERCVRYMEADLKGDRDLEAVIQNVGRALLEVAKGLALVHDGQRQILDAVGGPQEPETKAQDFLKWIQKCYGQGGDIS